MATPPEAYFPSLDGCLFGEKQLISWKAAFLRTVSPTGSNGDCEKLSAFLHSSDAFRTLSNPLQPFPNPSERTKSAFESKIAAANTANKSSSSCNLTEIKNDATWLSGKAQIDEVSALRIVVLEWQNRASGYLLSNFSEEEINSLRDAVGAGSLSNSIDKTEAAGILDYAAAQNSSNSTETDSNDIRKAKLFRLALSERQHSVKLSQHLLAAHACGKWRTNGASNGTNHSNHPGQKGLEEISSLIFGSQSNGSGHTQDGITVEGCIGAIRSRINSIESGSGWSNDANAASDLEVELAWQTSILDELYQITQILFLRIQMSGGTPSSQQLLSWLRLMVEYNFLEHFRPATEEQTTIFTALQSVISVTTLAFLKLRTVLSYFESVATQPANTRTSSSSNVPAILSVNDVADINGLFLQMAQAGLQTASPSLFGWGMIMYSVREMALVVKEEAEAREAQHALDSFNGSTPPPATYSPEPNVYENILERAHHPAFDDDFVRYLMSAAVDNCHVFDLIYPLINQLELVSGPGNTGFVCRLARAELLGLMRSCVEYLDYMPELVSSTLRLITQQNYYPSSPNASPLSKEACDAAESFLRDNVLMERIFRIAKSRFPFEAVNFLKICRALSRCHLPADEDMPFIAKQLEHMETYTQTVYSGFQGYRPIREDENANYVGLIQPLAMTEVASTTEQNAGHGSDTTALAMSNMAVVPAETMGQVINDSRPAIIMWHHRYNCLGFLGKWLEQATNKRVSEYGPHEDIVAETIGLLADLLTSADELSRSKGVESGARRILEMASDGLHHYGDIISVVYDIFERCLHDVGAQAGPNTNLDPVVSCVKFMAALVRVIPGRVWPFLARSSLLASDGKGGMLAMVVSAVEASSGDFSFLLSSIRLFELLVDDAVSHAALRKTAGRVNAKSQHISEFTAGIPSHVMRNSLLSIVRTMVEVYNSNASWRFDDVEQQLQINTRLTVTFRNILYYGYGISDDENLDAKITGVLSTSAQYLLSILRPTSDAGLPFNPILRIIFNGVKAPMPTTNLRLLCPNTRLVQSALGLAETLMQAGNLIKQPLSHLEKKLFNASPLLIRLYALDVDYRLPVVNLLDLLVSYASLESEQEPPSLLGHLGSESSCHLLDILSNFDQPFNDLSLRVGIWELLTTIISKRQQWLAVYILTGSSPRDVLKNEDRKDGPVMKRKPFLASSLDILSMIESMPLRVAVAALNFVAKSQENWPPWVKPQLRNHNDFFPKAASYVSNLKMQQLSPSDRCLNTKIAYLLADICTIYLHSAKEAWDWTFFKTIIPLVSWFSENAVQVDAYNGSLHANLKRNFEMKYPGCSIMDIKRTSLDRPELGDDYFYDVELGQKLYGYDFAWAASGKQGLVDEVKRANLNLSLVETQVALLHSFKFFAIEHCGYFMPDREIQKTMARVVRQCLAANSNGVPNEKIFHRIQQVRVELAMALLQRLVDVQCRGTEVFGILSVAWDTTRSRHPTYESALLNDDMEYYASLLNILFLALQFHLAGPHRSDPEALSKKPEVSSDLSIVLQIVKTVVAQGMRALTIYLHEESQRVSPKDFAVLTAILQTALKVKDVDRIYEQMSYDLVESDAIRYGATLFSWAYQLTVAGDPIYGELSILYLLELSCIPMVAEQMAVDGLLANLSTYRLTEVLRQPQGCGPFDAVPRLFAIWNSGMLRLCLNLLYHVGRTAPEVSAFLNQFDGQLRRASNAFSIGHPASAPAKPLSGSVGPLSSSQSTRGISLGLASEAASLALISVIIRKFRSAGPSAGVDSQQIQELKWDGAQVKDDIEGLLEKRAMLRSRLAPTNETELAWSRQAASDTSGGTESLLEEKIVKELKAAASCIEGAESK